VHPRCQDLPIASRQAAEIAQHGLQVQIVGLLLLGRLGDRSPMINDRFRALQVVELPLELPASSCQ